jgi:hypothetical protein
MTTQFGCQDIEVVVVGTEEKNQRHAGLRHSCVKFPHRLVCIGCCGIRLTNP